MSSRELMVGLVNHARPCGLLVLPGNGKRDGLLCGSTQIIGLSDMLRLVLVSHNGAVSRNWPRPNNTAEQSWGVPTADHTLCEGNNEPTTNKPRVVDTRHGRAEVAEHKSPDTSSGHSIQKHV